MNLETKPLIYNIYIYIYKIKKIKIKPDEATNPDLYFQQINKTKSKSEYLAIMKGPLQNFFSIRKI